MTLEANSSEKHTLYACNHCTESGTCTNGHNGSSCLSCLKKNTVHFWERKKYSHGIICGVCGGLGRAELMTARMNERTKPMLAIWGLTILPLLIVFSLIYKSDLSGTVVTLAGTLMGSIITYYFSLKNRNS